MNTEQLEQLIKWITANSSRSSIFLDPFGTYSVNTQDLLDKIHELSGIEKEVIRQWVDEIADELDKR